MQPWVDGLIARGIEAWAIDLRRGKAEDAMPGFESIVPAGADVVVGGQSFGGRVASLSAAQRPYAGLVCLSYPLHRPGAPETAAQRSAHWPAIACPALLLSGTSDPFARIDLLRAALPAMSRAELVEYPRLGHGLTAVREDVLDRIAAFVRSLEP
jgi:predicted alpha/beta-hydrolase family hydrolase